MRRPHLERLLDDDRRRPVTLVSGVAGSGKTTLVASWAEQRDRPVTWLTLDERDDRPGAFAQTAVAALGSPLIGGSDDDLALLDRTFHELAAEGHPSPSSRRVLVIDEADVLTTPTARAALAHLVRRSPPHLDVIVCSRSDRVLPVGRLRLERNLGEIRDAALTFRLAEAADLYADLGTRLRREDLVGIVTATEGWVGGLRLFGTAMDGGVAPGLLAGQRDAGLAAVEDYLVDEVLAGLEPTTEEFLTRTSVVDELTVELAALLSGSATAGGQLEELRHDGMFLSESPSDEVYRYHALFRALLRRRLRRVDPSLARGLHATASSWYEARGAAVQAEDHARAAEDWPRLGELLVSRWLDGTVRGVRTPTTLLDGIPGPAVAAHRPLATIATAIALEAGVQEVVLESGRDADRDVRGTPDRVLDLVRARSCGPDRRATTSVLALRSGPAAVRRWAALRDAEMDVDRGSFEQARAALGELADGEGSPIALDAAGLLAVVDALEGRLPAARSVAADVLRSAPAGTCGDAAARLAVSLSEAQAGRQARAASVSVDAEVIAPSRVLRTVARVVAAWCGDASSPIVLERAVVRRPVADLALVALGVLEVQDSTGSLVVIGGPDEATLRAARQVLTAGGSSASAATVVAPALDGARTHPRTAIDLRILAAVSAAAEDPSGVALDHLRVAVDLAAASGVRAPLVAPCPRLVSLLGVLAAEGNGQQAVALELLETIGSLHGPVFVEQLTDQERAVLGFLPTLMSNQEIATAMHLSVNTVKSHVKAVYRKLGVERRRHAVVRARQLELI